MSAPRLRVSGFADEASETKLVKEQFAVMSALGLNHLSLRFVDAGKGIKNVLQLDDDEVSTVLSELDAYGLQVSSLGSPIGKVKLFDFDDHSNNQYFDANEYLDNQVQTACRLANRFGTKLIRGFSFYHPRGEEPEPFLPEAAARLAAICDVCDAHGLTFGLEVEANLVGQNANTLMQIHREVNSEALVLIFDGANLVTQGYQTPEVFEQFEMMLPALGWIHIKDYLPSNASHRPDYVDEEALDQFVPAGAGASDYPRILNKLSEHAAEIQARLAKRGIAGLYADMEPHLKQGGQFGGFSGPDGFGIATREFLRLCDQAGFQCDLKTVETLRA